MKGKGKGAGGIDPRWGGREVSSELGQGPVNRLLKIPLNPGPGPIGSLQERLDSLEKLPIGPDVIDSLQWIELDAWPVLPSRSRLAHPLKHHHLHAQDVCGQAR